MLVIGLPISPTAKFLTNGQGCQLIYQHFELDKVVQFDISSVCDVFIFGFSYLVAPHHCVCILTL